jgi:hypothetical protein
MSKAIKAPLRYPNPYLIQIYIYNISLIKDKVKAVAKAFSIKRH